MDKTSEKPKSFCARLCQGKLCIPLIAVAVIAGIAVALTTVLTSSSVRERFPPDLKWWQKSIVYQIYPRSFQDSDGDGVGDLPGIISRLDYFTYLNVKALWISPFYPSPMKDFGYDTTSHVEVDPLFGNLFDFDNLLREAHKRDIRVIIDFVAGYTSSDHPWFKKSEQRIEPYAGYYVWAAGKTLDNGTTVPPSNWISSFGYSAWTWSKTRQEYFYHSFTPSQPQVNYRCMELREEMKNIIRFWLERGVDGMRVDAIAYMMVSDQYYEDQKPSNKSGTQWWQLAYWIPSLTQNVLDIGLVVKEWGEVLDSYDDSDSDTDHSKFMVVELYDPPKIRNRYYAYGADMPFNFDLIVTMNPVYHTYCDAICIRDVIQEEYDTLPDGKWANFVLSNHDNKRASSRLGPLYTDALIVLLLTLRGTPTTYYGEEIGMEDIVVSFAETRDPWGINYGPDHYQEVSRDPARSPMQWNSSSNAGFTEATKPWLPLHPNFRTTNVETEKNSTEMATIKLYRDLAILREEPSLQYGLLTFGDVTPSILFYLRSAQDNPDYLVIINFGNMTLTHDFSGPPASKAQGRVKVATSAAVNEKRFYLNSAVTLSSVTLNPGDGLVIEL